MRAIVYVVAVIAAVGIMVTVASRPASETSQASTTLANPVSAQPMPDSGKMTLSVPEMMCPVSCYPRVKKALENTAAVDSVELAPQKVEGEIDNRKVIVNYNAGFKLDDALNVLKKEGFTDNEWVQ